MFKNVLGIFSGICLLQVSAALPPWAGHGWVVAAMAFGALVFCWRVRGQMRGRRRTARAAFAVCVFGLAAAILMGYAYAAWRADLRLSDALDVALEGRDVQLTGRIASLPDDSGDGLRFVFESESEPESEPARDCCDANGDAQDDYRAGTPGRILLSWYRGHWGGTQAARAAVPALQPGELWRLTVRLKRPHGSAVPGGFDYEAWLLERGLRATGYVRSGELLAADGGGFMNGVHRLRARIRQQFEAALPDAPYRGILVALAVGDQGAIPSGQWEILRRTGVQHLVAISGLHISLVALAVGGLCVMLWRRVPRLVLCCPARLAGALAGLSAAGVYALLAGLGIPVQRAFVMLAAAALAMAARREMSARNVLMLALLAVLLVDPWATLAAGFWLSFGAVATILLTMGGRTVPMRGWRAAVKLQLAITLATIPALVALFQGFSLASPPANAFAIPLVSFAIAPLVLAAAIYPANWLLELAHTLTAWMMDALQYLSSFPFALREHPLPPPWLLAIMLAVAIVTILPRGTPGRIAALAVLGGFLFWRPEPPRQGDFRAVVLDVGQGLAVHVQTANHNLLYDTGPLYGRESNAGERVVVPYLRARGVTTLDAIAISHDDDDHAGGLESVRARVGAGEIIAGGEGAGLAGEGASGMVRGIPCVDGLQWRWDDVDFAVLAPEALSGERRGNNLSCVLRVRGAGGVSLLLTGDIESGSEYSLVSRHGGDLASTAVVAAHHGSRSSSSAAFVAAVRPEVAIFSAGYRNRYGHPHPRVLERWEDAGARNMRTDNAGTVLLDAKDGKLLASGWRETAARYWHGR
ncbi:MAG: DNA internalization-related competence protein ComEC/Rec2 [Azoarcus sp.]|nr:DNA internalization-related competence protein ComEC/Rec2 [Azoarcus sp.]